MSRCKLQVRREVGAVEGHGQLTVMVQDRPVFDLEAGELKAIFADAGPVTIGITAAGKTLLRQNVVLPEDHVLLLSLGKTALPWWRIFLGQRPALALSEISRTYLAPYDPGPVRTLVQQTWIGRADSEDALFAVMEERDDYYSDENFEREGTPEHMSLSGFADVMGETSYDHDYLEYGFAKPGEDIETRFAGHSWVEQWAPVLRATLPAEELASMNVYVMFGVHMGGPYGDRRQISEPHDLDLPGVRLRYIGEVSHPSH